MKIKVLSRSLDTHLPSSTTTPAPLHKNLDPSIHPLIRPREYTRAVASAKLNRLFAKPFVGQLEGHRDGVYEMCRDPKALGRVASGSGDGEIRVWELGGRRCTAVMKAHKGKVGGVAFLPTRVAGEARNLKDTYDTTPTASSSRFTLDDHTNTNDDESGDVDDESAALKREEAAFAIEEARTSRLGSRKLLSCGIDKVVKLWDVAGAVGSNAEGDGEVGEERLVTTYEGRNGFNAIDCHADQAVFATASDRVQIWDVNKSSPLMDLTWNASRSSGSHSKKASLASAAASGDHLLSLHFSPSQPSLLASSGSDRSITLYDLRTQTALSRNKMGMRGNCVRWNPRMPGVLLVGGEDHQCYTFDMRNLGNALQVYKDHVGALVPTGRSFISGSYDRTLRLWSSHPSTSSPSQPLGRSTDTYHTKRMQRIFSTLHTLDSRFLLTASSDGGIRLWKSNASETLGVVSGREKGKLEYGKELRSRWSGVEGVGKVERQRYLPKGIYHAQKMRAGILEARAVKEDRRRAHVKKGVEGKEKAKAERKKWILGVEK